MFLNRKAVFFLAGILAASFFSVLWVKNRENHKRKAVFLDMIIKNDDQMIPAFFKGQKCFDIFLGDSFDLLQIFDAGLLNPLHAAKMLEQFFFLDGANSCKAIKRTRKKSFRPSFFMELKNAPMRLISYLLKEE